MTTPVIRLGSIRTYFGVRYTVVDVQPHTRRDGRLCRLVTWRAACRACGQPFETRRGVFTHRLTQNCRLHLGQRLPAAPTEQQR
jgi:hypothetical protein